MKWLTGFVLGLFIFLGTMWFVKNICKMKLFKNWGTTKHFVFVVGLIIGSFFLKHFLLCYSGIDEAVMWMRLLGNQLLFPRFLWVFGIVNLLVPGLLVLSFRGIKEEMSFLQSSFGAASCLAVAGFTWHFVYMYPGVDESIAFFSALTITIMIFYGYRLAVKRNIIEKPQKRIEVMSIVAGAVLFLAIAARYVIRAFGKFSVGYTFRRMDFGSGQVCFYIVFTLLYMAGHWYFWGHCKSFSRRVFALPAVLMPSLRWGYALLMNFGVLPTIEHFVGIPFTERYAVYDLMCLGILVCMLWKGRDKKMLLVRTPIDGVKMFIEEDVLEKIIGERVYKNESALMQMKRFFYSTAEEWTGDVFAWIDFISFLYENDILDREEEEEIVSRVNIDKTYIYLIGETEDTINEVEDWLSKFMNKEDLQFSHYIMPWKKFFGREE